MGLRVRYRANDLGEQGLVETIAGVDEVHVHDDNTVEMRVLDTEVPEGYRTVGYLHPHRWDSVQITQEAQA